MLARVRTAGDLLPGATPPCRSPRSVARGITLLELMLTLAVVGIVATLSIPVYRSVMQRLEVNKAVQDLLVISQALQRTRIITFELPASLAELRNVPTVDPWGRPYQYLNFATGSKGKIRKDHNLHPLNTEFDLYSMGRDGKSVPPLTGRPSRDDIIWARDGSFVGKASDF